MTPFYKKALCLLCAGAAALTMTACGAKQTPQPNTPVPAETTSPVVETTESLESVESLTLILQAGELYTLDRYPNLKSVDLSGSTCFDALYDYAQQHPHIDVTYTVDIGGIMVSNKDAILTLPAGSFNFDTFLQNLQYLPAVTHISLPGITLTAPQIASLRETYPQIALNYTVDFLGNTLDVSTTELDLSAMDASQVEEAAQKLGLLSNLASVRLSDGLSMEHVAKLQDACPQATFHYNFSLYGKSLSTTDTEVIFKDYSIGNEGESQIRAALSILDNCSRFVLDNCGLDYELLAQIREDFRSGPKVVWRVYYGVTNRYTNLTDDEMLRAVYNVTDSTCGPMKYCEDVKYMDIGHNETLTDLSFIGYMPNIEVVIASGSAVKELPGFENCKKLTWLELAYCYNLENVDPLEGCESLRFLNISYSDVTNLMPLDGLPLERFMYLSPKASKDEREIFAQIHPDCLSVYSGQKNPYGYGWRYDDNGYTFNEYYKNVIRKAFNYDYLESLL